VSAARAGALPASGTALAVSTEGEAIARGLAARPQIVLLDEPSLGLAPAIVDALYRVLEELRSQGTTILLVDQMARLALSIADRAYVLQSGRVVQQGSAEEIRNDAALEKAYLG